MVERVQPALVGPWVRGWVKTNLSGGGRVHLTNKWECSVQVGVPGYRTGGKKRRRNESCSGVDQRLKHRQSDISQCPLVGVTDLECVGRRGAGRREPSVLATKNVNITTPKYGNAQKNNPTELRRFATRREAAREAENAPILLRAAAGSLWSILAMRRYF